MEKETYRIENDCLNFELATVCASACVHCVRNERVYIILFVVRQMSIIRFDCSVCVVAPYP